MSEKLGNLGYLAVKKQTAADTAVIPDVFMPLYSETVNTNYNLVDQMPIYGEKFANFDVLQGQRSHRGDITVPAEPNTSARLFDSLLTKVSTTGAGPYTHTFELSKTIDPNPYTYDISNGYSVKRLIGFQAGQISLVKEGNELRWQVTGSALKSFTTRKISAVTGTGPYTIELDSFYDPAPTDGLVVGDLIAVQLANGTVINAIVDTVASDTEVTVSEDVSTAVAGDFIYIRPSTITFDLLPTLLWSRSQFRFADDAAAALTATQIRVEEGSSYDIIHSFENDDGAMRSGGFDPAALPRTTGTANISIQKIFEGGEDVEQVNNLTKQSLVVRHFTGSGNEYEVRAVFNHIKTDGTVLPQLESGSIEYEELNYRPINDTTDGKGMQIVIINGEATI
ncbi:MAG: hypothetical protein KGZ81_07435 [Flavobacteriales bacterium]|nr:hypothetical protein [Flavobacteriales bacterium]